MPGIDEEIMFRAVFLGIMLNALKERISFSTYLLEIQVSS
jgi:hypothetical protein